MHDYIATYHIQPTTIKFSRYITAASYLEAVKTAEAIRNDNEQLLGVRESFERSTP